MNLAPSVFQNPGRDFRPRPQAAVSRRHVERLLEFGLLLARQDEDPARVGVAMVPQTSGSSLGVPMDQRPNPGNTLAGDLSTLIGGFALGQQPDNLPVAPFHGFFGGAIAGCQLFKAQVGLDG